MIINKEICAASIAHLVECRVRDRKVTDPWFDS